MPAKEKRRYITYRVDAYLRDRFIHTRKQKPRELFGESFVRFINHVKFCVVCCASLSQAVAPWMLSASEVVAVLLIYFLGVSRSLVIHQSPKKYHFSWRHSVEDMVCLSMVRAAILSIAYALGSRSAHRPYLYVSYLLAASCFPYIVVKTILYRYSKDAVSAAAIFALTGAYCWFHVFAARRTVEWARRRYQMGLPGFGMPWEQGEDAWQMLKRPDLEEMTKTSDGGGPDGSEDVPPEMLADDDSKFVEIGDIKVHYKEVLPQSALLGAPHSGVGIVLVHGFGGGLFAWRHVMEALAMQCQCRVVAFDRPAFGLTSRPKVTQDSNHYTMAAQSQLTLQLCIALGLQQVVLVAHADGCLVAVQAAAAAMSCQQQPLFHFHLPEPITSFSDQPRSAPASAESTPRFLSTSPPTSTAPDQYIIDAQSFAEGLRDSQASGQSDRHGDDSERTSASARLTNRQGSSKNGASTFSVGSPVDGELGLARGDTSGELDRLSQTSRTLATLAAHRRTQSLPSTSGMEVACESSAVPNILGMVLMHPSLSGMMGPGFSRLLARSKLGRSILRPLLRTEIGEVANRRAWHNTDKLTPEVLDLYKAPLRVEGWDSALMETTRLRQELSPGDLATYFGIMRQLPVLAMTGEYDRIAPPAKVEALSADLPHSQLSILPDCGHLSHEEVPVALLEHLVPFCGQVLSNAMV